jgi:hypothetical protein
MIPPAQRGKIIPFPVLDSNSVPALFRLALPPVFDFGGANRHKFILTSWAGLPWYCLKPVWLEQAVFDRKACHRPMLSLALDCHLTVRHFDTSAAQTVERKPFIS